MVAHNNGRAFRLSAKRWKGGCIQHMRKSGGCKLNYKHCNLHACVKYKEKEVTKYEQYRG